MERGSVIESESRPSASFGSRCPSAALSLTYAFMSVVFQNDVYFFPKTDVRDTRIYLGEGATSTVYKAFVNPSQGTVKPQVIAIKQKRRRGSWFNEDISFESWLQTCYLDLRIMSHRGLKHAKNITTVLGYFWEEINVDEERRLSPCLVMPAASDGATSLDRLFKDVARERSQLRIDLKIQICRDIANGLQELHNGGVVHGDLKLGNILLFGDFREGLKSISAKVADFSHSFVMSDYTFNSGTEPLRYTGTRPFTIPEVRRQDRTIEQSGTICKGIPSIALADYYACDIYSLGLLLCAVLNDGVDLPDRLRAAAGFVADDLFVEEALDQLFERPLGPLAECKRSFETFNLGLDEDLTSVVEACLEICLQDEPRQRGRAEAVAKKLSLRLCDELPSVSQDTENATAVPQMYGSLYEFSSILSTYSSPPIPDLVQSQIIAEVVEKSKSKSPDAEHFLASCFALGFGTSSNNAKALDHLTNAALLGHQESNLIKDRVAQAILPDCTCERSQDTIYSTYVQTGLLGDFRSTLNPDYTERVRWLKVLSGLRGSGTVVRLSYSGNKRQGLTKGTILDIVDGASGDGKTVKGRIERVRSRSFCYGAAQDDALTDIANGPYDDDGRLLLSGVGNALRKHANNMTMIDDSFEDAISKLRQIAELCGSQSRPGGLFDVAAGFVGADSTFSAQLKVVQFLKAVVKFEGTSEIDKPNRLGETPLLVACRCGQSLAVRYLLHLGANPRLADNAGITPLHWLSLFEDGEMRGISQLLSDAGAVVDAVTTSVLDLPEHCLNFQPGCTPLHYAVGMRSLAAVKTLLSFGANPFSEAELSFAFHGYRLTPLHFAVCLHFHEIVEELLRVPGTSSNVLFRRIDEVGKKASAVSIVHLVSVRFVMPSDMAPFAHWVVHGKHYEEALEKTLKAISSVFPEKNVLMLQRHSLSVTFLPPEDPYILRALKRLEFCPKKLSPEELGLEAESAPHQGENWGIELWMRGAVNGSNFKKSSPTMMNLALTGLNNSEEKPSPAFVYEIIEHCATRDMEGPLGSLLGHLKLQLASAQKLIPFFFWLAAGHDAVAVMNLFWDMFSKEGGEGEDAAAKFLDFTWRERSPLHQAAEANAVRAIAFLLDRGAKIDLDIGENGTPLCLAGGTFNSRDAAVLLLEKGASIYCCKDSGDGFTVLHGAVANPDVLLKGEQQFSLVRILLETCPARFLHDKHNVLNSTDKFGQTVIHLAARKSDIKTVVLLLEVGDVDLTITDAMGQTPLMIALQRAHFGEQDAEGFIQWLIEQKMQDPASIDQRLRDQKWLDERSQHIAQMLIDAGSPIPKVDEITGEYSFLIEHAAREIFKHVAEPGLQARVHSLFENFKFFKNGGRSPGLPPQITMSLDGPSISIFPQGIFRGAPVLTLKRTDSGVSDVEAERPCQNIEALASTSTRR